MDDPIDPSHIVDLFDQGVPASDRADQPVFPSVPSQPKPAQGRSGGRLTSSMLLGARGVPGTTPPPQPAFDVVTNGLDPEQVQSYLDLLLNWGQRQVRRAEGAEQTLAEAVNQLREADSGSNRLHVAAGTGTAKTTRQPHPAPPADAGEDATKTATVHPINTLWSVPRPRSEGGKAEPPRRDKRTTPILAKRSTSRPVRPSAVVSRLDDRLIAAALTSLLGGSRWDQFRGRRSPWSAFHLRSLKAGSRHLRSTIVAGPTGLFSVVTPYHRGAEVVVDRSHVLINGDESAEAARTAEEAERAGELLRELLTLPDSTRSDCSGTGDPEVRERNSATKGLVVRPVLAFVGARSVHVERPGRMIVTTTANLAAYLRALPVHLTDAQLDDIAALRHRAQSGLI